MYSTLGKISDWPKSHRIFFLARSGNSSAITNLHPGHFAAIGCVDLPEVPDGSNLALQGTAPTKNDEEVYEFGTKVRPSEYAFCKIFIIFV